MPDRESIAGTCILHFTSSIGVRRIEVKAPETAPQPIKADKGSGSVLGRRVT
jgi:hypothetical protein